MAAPTRSPTRTTTGRARLALALAVVVVAVLAGCSTVGSLTGLVTDLRDEGFTSVKANIHRSDPSVLVVSADRPDGTTVAEAQDQAAEIVWTQFPRRFEGLRLTIDGERRIWTYEELEEELGPRPEGLDSEGDLGDDLDRFAVFVLIGILVAGVLGVALIAVIVLLVMRASRRNAATRARSQPQPWMPPDLPAHPGTPGPVPPPGGWTPASTPTGTTTAPPTPTSTPDASTLTAPSSSAPLSLSKGPQGEAGLPAGPPPPPWEAVPPPPPPGRRPRDPDARRLGRRPRGPRPDASHTPPGWG